MSSEDTVDHCSDGVSRQTTSGIDDGGVSLSSNDEIAPVEGWLGQRNMAEDVTACIRGYCRSTEILDCHGLFRISRVVEGDFETHARTSIKYREIHIAATVLSRKYTVNESISFHSILLCPFVCRVSCAALKVVVAFHS
jgi:hypothetical protein